MYCTFYLASWFKRQERLNLRISDYDIWNVFSKCTLQQYSVIFLFFLFINTKCNNCCCFVILLLLLFY